MRRRARRRESQVAHNRAHGIRPTALRKKRVEHTVAARYPQARHPTAGTSYNRRMAEVPRAA
ncbi:hypothetical protein ACFQLX_22975 [Streptomyces polyrhachis]|uniref:UvrB YAD/RRR-motif-containing domain-containing protein n=1 Tax=Streptomyces polyrhachis TaxID=1282885 RepID=A0ABW2GMV1_9ACTN